MTRPECAAARTAQVRGAGDDATRSHLAACEPCRAFCGRLSRVDAALSSESGIAAPVSTALRARVLAAAGRSARPRGRLLELAARAAAVAAVLVGGLWLVPAPVFAAEVDLSAIRLDNFDIERRLADLDIAPRLAEHVTSIPDIALQAPAGSPVDPAVLAAVAAGACALALAAWLAPSRGSANPNSRRS